MNDANYLLPGYLPRTLEPVIERANRRFKGIMVTGMRQVGKSTMLRTMMGGARKYLNLDRFQLLDLAKNDREAFFKQYPFPVLIDEFQRVPDLGLEIKALLDETNERGLVWMTGSQKLGLSKAVAEALSGRVVSYELFPLSLYERQGKGLEQKPFLPRGDLGRGTLNPLTVEEIWNIIWQGSWPEHIHDEPEERDAFYDSLLRTYIEKDAFSSGVRRIEDFDRFLSILATRIGQEFAIGEVQKEAGIAAETARAWLNVAEATGVIYLLPPFYENVGKTLIKKHKLYFTDTGFAAWLCKSPSPQALRKTYNAGAFFENFVVMEIVKSWKHNGKRPLFYFYRDAQRKEIDLLIREGETYYPIEIKTTDSPQRRMLDNFGVLKGETIKRGPGVLICTCPEAQYLASDVTAMPVWDL
ncbi:ATP-binding protein [uncultured Sutterella sp.]|uniref:ATP-binding protein n=1 Tax=uncultured Sutterella sp. TaxID=286133 RepID=UPI00261259E9|nr:ATP-binding protein [uncultured Sutterella sp.]